MAIVGSPWGPFDTRLVSLASAIDAHLRDSGRPRLHEAARITFGVGELVARLADLSEALSATETARMDDETAEAFRAAVGHLRASVDGLRRGGAALRR